MPIGIYFGWYQSGITIFLIVTMIIINQLQHYWKNILVNMSIHTNDTNDENNDTWIYIHGFIHMSKLWWAWIICYGHSIFHTLMIRTLLLWASNFCLEKKLLSFNILNDAFGLSNLVTPCFYKCVGGRTTVWCPFFNCHTV